MSGFKPNKTMCDGNATVLLNVYSYLVFVGEGWLALVPSYLPHLRELSLDGCYNVCDKYIEELRVAVPELEIFATEKCNSERSHLETSYSCCTSAADVLSVSGHC
jgi:hypothetical protein